LSSTPGYVNFLAEEESCGIEAELETLTPNELRRLALKSWRTFVEKECRNARANECSEADPELLAALDEATERSDAAANAGLSGDEVCARLSQWTSK